MELPKLLRVPVICKTKAMLIGTIEKLENVESLVVLVEDDDGVWIIMEEGISLERINWMLDRGKILIHE